MTILEKIKKGESRTLEFKEKIERNKLNLLKTIVAFILLPWKMRQICCIVDKRKERGQ